jgi:hypothetical protein
VTAQSRPSAPRLAEDNSQNAFLAERNIALGALAVLANLLRGAVRLGTEPGLEATAYFQTGQGRGCAR